MTAVETADDPVASAKEAGLRYVSDEQPGITRRQGGKGFRYLDAAGKLARSTGHLRLEEIAVLKMLQRQLV